MRRCCCSRNSQRHCSVTGPPTMLMLLFLLVHWLYIKNKQKIHTNAFIPTRCSLIVWYRVFACVKRRIHVVNTKQTHKHHFGSATKTSIQGSRYVTHRRGVVTITPASQVVCRVHSLSLRHRKVGALDVNTAHSIGFTCTETAAAADVFLISLVSLYNISCSFFFFFTYCCCSFSFDSLCIVFDKHFRCYCYLFLFLTLLRQYALQLIFALLYLTRTQFALTYLSLFACQCFWIPFHLTHLPIFLFILFDKKKRFFSFSRKKTYQLKITWDLWEVVINIRQQKTI